MKTPPAASKLRAPGRTAKRLFTSMRAPTAIRITAATIPRIPPMSAGVTRVSTGVMSGSAIASPLAPASRAACSTTSRVPSDTSRRSSEVLTTFQRRDSTQSPKPTTTAPKPEVTGPSEPDAGGGARRMGASSRTDPAPGSSPESSNGSGGAPHPRTGAVRGGDLRMPPRSPRSKRRVNIDSRDPGRPSWQSDP